MPLCAVLSSAVPLHKPKKQHFWARTSPLDRALTRRARLVFDYQNCKNRKDRFIQRNSLKQSNTYFFAEKIQIHLTIKREDTRFGMRKKSPHLSTNLSNTYNKTDQRDGAAKKAKKKSK
jgi:hypothetical protein